MKDPDFFKLIENIFVSIRPKKRDKFCLKYFEKFDTLANISTFYSLQRSLPSISQVKGGTFLLGCLSVRH